MPVWLEVLGSGVLWLAVTLSGEDPRAWLHQAPGQQCVVAEACVLEQPVVVEPGGWGRRGLTLTYRW